MHAIQGRHEQTAQALLDAARVAGLERCLSEAGESSGGGLTPLQFACSEKLSWVVKALLVAGADTEARDSTGATALLRSCRTVREAWYFCIYSYTSNEGLPFVS